MAVETFDFGSLKSALSEPMDAIADTIDKVNDAVEDFESSFSRYEAGLRTGAASYTSFGKPLDTAMLAASVFAGATQAGSLAAAAGGVAGFIVGQALGAIMDQIWISQRRRTAIQIWNDDDHIIRNNPVIQQDPYGARRAYAGHSSFKEWLEWHRRLCPALAKWQAGKDLPYHLRPKFDDDPYVLKKVVQTAPSGTKVTIPNYDHEASRRYLQNKDKVKYLQPSVFRFLLTGQEVAAGSTRIIGDQPNMTAVALKGNEASAVCFAVGTYDPSRPPVGQLAYDMYEHKVLRDANLLLESVGMSADFGDVSTYAALPGLEAKLHVRFIDGVPVQDERTVFGHRLGDIPYWVPLSSATPALAQQQLLRAWSEHGASAQHDNHLREMARLHPADGIGPRTKPLSSYNNNDARKVLANATAIVTAATRGQAGLFEAAMGPIIQEINARGMKITTQDLDEAWRRLLKVDVIHESQLYYQQQTKRTLAWVLALGASILAYRSWRQNR